MPGSAVLRFEKGKGAIVRIEGTDVRKLLTYAPYLGMESTKLLSLLETLGKEITAACASLHPADQP
ncbi:MAG: hypothetical protein JW795_24020 [Chitinivibrionales bacterium]|nr:hypothetical protein [Chitinivibrionales bacterium]